MSIFTIGNPKQFTNEPNKSHVSITCHNENGTIKGTKVVGDTRMVHELFESLNKKPYVDKKDFLHTDLHEIIDTPRELVELVLGV